ncbi:ester cyclase [Haladaptatus salinisoli]|uniref:ester cyclase n=1 Tax=Haladaptatus salinisoli TaxID=2884876 RepID=UPI001D0A21AD|nr:ester cyclase [Haladaptatus salinisoli]
MSTTTTDNEAVVRRDAEAVWNSDGDLDAIDDLVADDFVYHNPMVSREVRGADEYRAMAERLRSAFSNLDMEIDELVAEGDAVATRYTTRGTHTGEIVGVEPTNKDIEVTGILIDHFEDGKIKERRVNDDALGLFTQIGAVDPPEGSMLPR